MKKGGNFGKDGEGDSVKEKNGGRKDLGKLKVREAPSADLFM